MKIAKNSSTNPPWTPEERLPKDKVKVANVSSAIDAELRIYLKQAAAGISSLDAVGANALVTVGSPVRVTQYAEFLSLCGVKMLDVGAATELISGICEIGTPSLSGAQVVKLAENTFDFMDQLMPEPPAGAAFPFHLFGILRTLPRLASALIERDSENNAEVMRSLVQFLASCAPALTDISGMGHFRPAAESLLWIVQVGEKVLPVPDKDVSALRRSLSRANASYLPTQVRSK